MALRYLRWSCSIFCMARLHGTPVSSSLEQRLAAALERVRMSVHDFDNLRISLQGENLSRLQGLAPEEVSLLQGSRSLESEFSSLQERATPLLEISQDLQDEAAVPFLQDLESFEHKLSAHLLRVRNVLAVRVGPAVAAPNSVPLQGSRVSPGASISPETDKRLSQVIQVITDTMGSVEQVQMQVRQQGTRVDPRVVSESHQLDVRFKTLQQKGAQLASSPSEPMRELDASQYCDDLEAFARDLADMSQRLSAASTSSGSQYGGAENLAAGHKVTLNPLGAPQGAPPKVTMGAMPPASLGGPMGAMPMAAASGLDRSPSGQPAPWDVMPSGIGSRDIEKDPMAGLEGFCTKDAVKKAADRFDVVVKKFNKKDVKEEMNKPQLDNLQRVVHGLQVLRHSLISDLAAQADTAEIQPSSELLSSCGRYFQGVEQLESDLVYFREQRAKTKAESKNRKKSKTKAINSIRHAKARQ
eukprot:gnl/MRDRNA2_/MRDRNA2_115473_c0_seq1.p1 gnl/MRDRNA2_/MRDRNA2_115473_c0~~gnl/MRDRNA2_/MRDRNA2_115473_c0_seq1.p1  ORF type:complete len:471 (+),score=82.16 gnl/MRDRNA2_/MRDRNA2_115473_c0_seq1:95-1507(+)